MSIFVWSRFGRKYQLDILDFFRASENIVYFGDGSPAEMSPKSYFWKKLKRLFLLHKSVLLNLAGKVCCFPLWKKTVIVAIFVQIFHNCLTVVTFFPETGLSGRLILATSAVSSWKIDYGWPRRDQQRREEKYRRTPYCHEEDLPHGIIKTWTRRKKLSCQINRFRRRIFRRKEMIISEAEWESSPGNCLI